MNVIGWLDAYAPGFGDLADEERQAITGFSFLWSLFEAKALNANASVGKMELLVQRWDKEGKLPDLAIDEQLAYFRDRYFDGSAFTARFERLNH